MDRSNVMRRVKSKDTGAELWVRRTLHKLGYRYRLHRSDLPGKPDLVFGPRKKVILVNGCFWHGHTCERGARIPKTNEQYWVGKTARNIERDASNIESLRLLGWSALTVWECEIRADPEDVAAKMEAFLAS